MRLLIATLAAVFALTATASAQVVGIDWLPMWTNASIQYWGHGTLPTGCDSIGIGWAPAHGNFAEMDAPCHFTIDPDQWHAFPDVRDRCEFVVHEIGHIYGHPHTKTGIMAPSIWAMPTWNHVKPCADTMRRSGGRSGSRLVPWLEPPVPDPDPLAALDHRKPR